jgi:hypothetical protein
MNRFERQYEAALKAARPEGTDSDTDRLRRSVILRELEDWEDGFEGWSVGMWYPIFQDATGTYEPRSSRDAVYKLLRDQVLSASPAQVKDYAAHRNRFLQGRRIPSRIRWNKEQEAKVERLWRES